MSVMVLMKWNCLRCMLEMRSESEPSEFLRAEGVALTSSEVRVKVNGCYRLST